MRLGQGARRRSASIARPGTSPTTLRTSPDRKAASEASRSRPSASNGSPRGNRAPDQDRRHADPARPDRCCTPPRVIGQSSPGPTLEATSTSWCPAGLRAPRPHYRTPWPVALSSARNRPSATTTPARAEGGPSRVGKRRRLPRRGPWKPQQCQYCRPRCRPQRGPAPDDQAGSFVLRARGARFGFSLASLAGAGAGSLAGAEAWADLRRCWPRPRLRASSERWAE